MIRQLTMACALIGLSGISRAESMPNGAVRPVIRPALVAISERAIGRPAVGILRSLRPQLRPAKSAVPATAVATATTDDPKPSAAELAGFSRWVRSFRDRAVAKGIRAATVDRAMASATFLPKVIERDRNQTEFTLAIGSYLARAASEARVENGRAMATEWARTLAAIERKYGVPSEIVAAVWGMESNYGKFRGDTHLVSALATLSYEGRRGAFFESQLIAALQILDNGDVTPDAMTSSWAGAMGHTQFIPTSYLAYAVDFTGDGRRDIWADDPSDALASTAAYLAKSGWVNGLPWGVEVVLPDGFNFARAGGTRMPSDWAALGVLDTRGGKVPDHGSARLLLPAGAKGAAFLVFKNFDVIKRYNSSDAYALGVGHLGDRIAGAGPLRGTWPEGERALKRAERHELQSLLSQKGYSTGGVDGRIGPNTVSALRAYQSGIGVVPDGHPSVSMLNRLRR